MVRCSAVQRLACPTRVGHAGLASESESERGSKMHMRKKRKRFFRNTSAAFTSVELLACLTACALLVAVITPVLTSSRSHSDRVACVNNLRHLERALRQFAMENYDYPPWRQFAPAGNYYEPGKHQL